MAHSLGVSARRRRAGGVRRCKPLARRSTTPMPRRVRPLACSAPPKDRQRWTLVELERAARRESGPSTVGRETVRRMLKKRSQSLAQADVLHRLAERRVPPPHVRPARAYARPLRDDETITCIDEKRLQLLSHSREPLPMVPGARGTGHGASKITSTFAKARPICSWPLSLKAEQRVVSATVQRGKVDFVQALLDRYVRGCTQGAPRAGQPEEESPSTTCYANALVRRVQFHYTPKHANWLNMAEIETVILSPQCLGRRISDRELLRSEVDAWEFDRHEPQRSIEWKFNRQHADRKIGRHNVS